MSYEDRLASFWERIARSVEAGGRLSVRDGRRHETMTLHRPGHRPHDGEGYGGATFRVVFLDGTTAYGSLWYDGAIPDEMADRLAPNVRIRQSVKPAIAEIWAASPQSIRRRIADWLGAAEQEHLRLKAAGIRPEAPAFFATVIERLEQEGDDVLAAISDTRTSVDRKSHDPAEIDQIWEDTARAVGGRLLAMRADAAWAERIAQITPPAKRDPGVAIVVEAVQTDAQFQAAWPPEIDESGTMLRRPRYIDDDGALELAVRRRALRGERGDAIARALVEDPQLLRGAEAELRVHQGVLMNPFLPARALGRIRYEVKVSPSAEELPSAAVERIFYEEVARTQGGRLILPPDLDRARTEIRIAAAHEWFERAAGLSGTPEGAAWAVAAHHLLGEPEQRVLASVADTLETTAARRRAVAATRIEKSPEFAAVAREFEQRAAVRGVTRALATAFPAASTQVLEEIALRLGVREVTPPLAPSLHAEVEQNLGTITETLRGREWLTDLAQMESGPTDEPYGDAEMDLAAAVRELIANARDGAGYEQAGADVARVRRCYGAWADVALREPHRAVNDRRLVLGLPQLLRDASRLCADSEAAAGLSILAGEISVSPAAMTAPLPNHRGPRQRN